VEVCHKTNPVHFRDAAACVDSLPAADSEAKAIRPYSITPPSIELSSLLGTMCVTNTTHRRIQAVTLNPNQLQVSPSTLSQRLLGSFTLSQIPSVPSSCATASVPSLSTVSTCDCSTAGITGAGGKSSSLGDGVQPYYGSCPSEELGSMGKPRPKRRRKPQKPGKTAKMNDRHFVVHNYHDHSNDVDDETDDHPQDQYYCHDDHHNHFHHSYSDESHGGCSSGSRRGGSNVPFPIKLHAVLEQVERDGYAHVVSWSPHGRCFVIHKPKQFTEEVMPKYVSPFLPAAALYFSFPSRSLLFRF
jgi:hypothetical protein